MKTVLAILVTSFTVLLIACGKDKFETKPRLEIKDYNSKEISQGQSLKIRINYYDKEGDLDLAPFVAIRKRLNKFQLPPAQEKADTLRYLLPEFPEKETGEISFEQVWDFLKESLSENDTIVFKIAVTDRAGNKSDTITTDQLVIRKP